MAMSGVSFLITAAQKAELQARGYTQDEIRNMAPAEAHAILFRQPGSPNGATAATSTASDLVARREVCGILHVSPATLENWEREGRGPPVRHIGTGPGRGPRWYSRAEVEAYAAGCARLNPAYADYLTPEETAELIGTSCEMLSTWVRKGKGPPYVRDGQWVRYGPREALLEWKATRLHNSKYPNGRNYHRRLKSETLALEQALFNIVAEQQPMTVRQVYYQAVVRGLVPKTDDGYNDVQLALVNMRKAFIGVANSDAPLDPDWLVDGSRRLHDWQVFISPTAAKVWLSNIYRKDVWADRDELIFLWIEKAALAQILVDVAGDYAVPVVVASGFNSISHINRVAHIIEDAGKPATIYYFRDRDPSGCWAPQSLQEMIEQLIPDEDVTIEVAAIDEWHVKEYGLEATAQPTKKEKNGHYPEFAKKYGKDAPSYELDALPPRVLRQLALECIQMHVSDEEHAGARAVEREEQARLRDEPIEYAWGP
jgi:hypothetical protein